MPDVDLRSLDAEFEAKAFPGSWTEWELGDLAVASNAGGHAIVLAASAEFWDDDGSAAEAEWERLSSVCRDHEVAATAAWGASHPVDITPRLARGEASPFTELLLEQGTTRGSFWNRGDRALGLSVCQMDKETAIQVIAFIVPTSALKG